MPRSVLQSSIGSSSCAPPLLHPKSGHRHCAPTLLCPRSGRCLFSSVPMPDPVPTELLQSISLPTSTSPSSSPLRQICRPQPDSAPVAPDPRCLRPTPHQPPLDLHRRDTSPILSSTACNRFTGTLSSASREEWHNLPSTQASSTPVGPAQPHAAHFVWRRLDEPDPVKLLVRPGSAPTSPARPRSWSGAPAQLSASARRIRWPGPAQERVSAQIRPRFDLGALF
jgi:hypothetical protein